MFLKMVLFDNNIIFFGTSQTQMTEKFSLEWESDPKPLAFQVSTLTAKPPRHLSVIVPPSKGLLLSTTVAIYCFWLRIPSSFTMFLMMLLFDNNLIFFGTSHTQMTEKFSFVITVYQL